MTNLYQTIKHCRGCHRPLEELRELVRMNPMPSVGPLNSSQEIALKIPKIPLTLLQCTHCGLVQSQEILNQEFQIDKRPLPTTQFRGLSEHYLEYAELLTERYILNGMVHFIEIGSNDGVLLNALPNNWNKLGIDSNSIHDFPENPSVQRIYDSFTNALVDKYQLDDWAHVVSITNLLSSTEDCRHLLQAASRLVLPGGELWIEEPSLEHLLAEEQWDLLHHSQTTFWNLPSLQACLDPLGLEYIESFDPVNRINLQRHVFRKGSPVLNEIHFEGISPHFLRLKSAYEKRFNSDPVVEILEARKSGKNIAALNASRRTQVYLNQIPILPIEFIIDEIPQRQNSWIPGRGILVTSPQMLKKHPIDYLLVSHHSEIEVFKPLYPEFKGKWIARFGK